MSFKEAVSTRIYELCEQNKFSPNKLAELSCIPSSTLRDLLNKKVANPSSYIIFRICKTLKIELKDFFDTDIFKISNIND